MESTNWNYPTNIWVGEGRHKEITQACDRFGISRLLVVVDSGLLNQSWVGELLEQLSSAYACTIKSDVPGNPTGDDVAAGCAQPAATSSPVGFPGTSLFMVQAYADDSCSSNSPTQL